MTWDRILPDGFVSKRREWKILCMKIRFAEDIRPDSSLDITSNENANASAEYIMKGSEVEIYEPRFTFFGFRYVEISS